MTDERKLNAKEQVKVWQLIKNLVFKNFSVTFCQRKLGDRHSGDYYAFYMRMTKWIGNVPYSYGFVWPVVSEDGISIEVRIKSSIEEFLEMKPKDFKSLTNSRKESSDIVVKINTPKSLSDD